MFKMLGLHYVLKLKLKETLNDHQRRNNHADAITDTVADHETSENKCNIPYTVTVQNSCKEEMLPLLRSLNAKQS